MFLYNWNMNIEGNKRDKSDINSRLDDPINSSFDCLRIVVDGIREKSYAHLFRAVQYIFFNSYR